MQKDYLALVRGQWQSHTKVVQAPLLKNILQSGERIVRVSQEGKPSETRFKVEERYEFATLVRCRPGHRPHASDPRSYPVCRPSYRF
ncbi:ribosomal large subunit pseudouridine synthase C [Klebsiella pneumoniae]|uniref:Ribosomal large subunit pseudouridine synthase C n=1 Tax=Klebsiella pneumoniae TaxID=573 RepID=A0A508ZXF8_KLEPN|nr:ribosomal large subunit pseudouridine synthase C [Klebsiella pneumoniae]